MPADTGVPVRPMKIPAIIIGLLSGCAFPAWLAAANLYVDGANGSDSADGLTPATAWRTIQRAADGVNPGDLVSIQPGVYAESVTTTRTGTAALPITFRATGPGTIVSGAHVAIRAGQAVWTLESGALNLYSTPLPAEPATVLSDTVDLFAYQTLAELQSFTRNTTPPVPGPQQGFAFASGKLYVRLNVRYGSLLPAAHIMKVSPVRAGGYRGDVIVQPSDYNWSVQTTAPAYVVIDGVTFESPGYAGVWIQYGNVTVRNCLFLGCRTGVRGWAESENVPAAVSRDVIVEGCEFSQYPAFQDMIDVVAVAESLTPAEQAAIPAFFWWSRKGGPRTSEIGLTTSAGLRWKILGNYIHDTIDGLSFLAIGWSDQCEVAYNRFEKLIDNAVEAEQHSQLLRVHHNFVRDVYEPFSYQPDAGPPYPASTWFYRNVVTLTPEMTAFWKKPILHWTPGCIKIKPPTTGFTSIGLEGLLFFNNTLHYPVGNVFTINSAGASAGPIKYYNNLVIADVLLTTPASPSFAGTTFSHNIVAPANPGQPGPGAIFAGTGGQTLASPAQMGLEDFASGLFRLASGSPAIGTGVVVAGLPGTSTDVGALPLAPQHQRFDQWRFQYFYDHLFEPEFSGALADGDQDGVSNLLECFFTRNPLLPGGAGPTTPSLDASGHLVLSFLRRTPLPEDVTWKVEASGDLVTWASGVGVTETLTPTPAGPDLTTEHVRDLTVLGQTPRFLRLQASQLDIPPGPVPESPLVRTLTVGSANPGSGVSISVSPGDKNGAGSGTTTFTRAYDLGSVVSLTAPGTAGGNNFQKWQKDGLDFSATATISVTVAGDHTPTAVYVAAGGGGQMAYVTGQALGTVRNNYTGYVGMKIGVGGIPVTVTALGRIFVSGNSGTHLVKLVNAANGSDVPGGSVALGMSGGTAGQFKYATLSSPVILAAGGTYYVVSQETVGGDAWHDFNTTVTTTSAAAELSAVYGSGGGTWIPLGAAGQTYGPVDFKYSSAP